MNDFKKALDGDPVAQLRTMVKTLATHIRSTICFVSYAEARRGGQELADAAMSYLEDETPALMPVPRCDGCKHWEYWKDRAGNCHENQKEHHLTSHDGLLTMENFGCVKWEAK